MLGSDWPGHTVPGVGLCIAQDLLSIRLGGPIPGCRWAGGLWGRAEPGGRYDEAEVAADGGRGYWGTTVRVPVGVLELLVHA